MADANRPKKLNPDNGGQKAAAIRDARDKSDEMQRRGVDVPYGNSYTPEKQTSMTRDRISGGLREVMDLVRSGAESCVDRAAVIEHATKLERQADKIQEAVQKDDVFIEEVRHHHNRLSDLCDNSRDYNQAQMVADLKRSAAIRVNIMTIIQGKEPDYEMDQDEMDDLKTVRNTLRRKFGGKKLIKLGMDDEAQVDQTAMLGDAGAVKASNVQTSFTAEQMEEDFLDGFLKSGGGWTAPKHGAKNM